MYVYSALLAADSECPIYHIRRNFRMAKFSKMTGLQAFRKNIFEN